MGGITHHLGDIFMKLLRETFVRFGLLILMLMSGVSFAESEMNKNWFGGESYQGDPALEVTAALIKAGGGAESFDFSTALVSMLGEETVNAEVSKLIEQYGEEEVTTFVAGMTFAVKSGIKHASMAGVTLPAAPAHLTGAELAKTLITAGTSADGTWWSGLLFDKALSNTIHNQVMADIEAIHGFEVDKLTHKILNQAMYDVAQALGYTNVKLAPLH